MISAILLAAGQSKRMNGENKLLKKIKDLPLINHCVENILSSSINEVIIVLGYQEKLIKKFIGNNKKIKFAFNKDFKSGMASSIVVGLNNLSKNTENFFVCLGDMPMVKKNIYNLLLESKKNKEIIVPTYKNIQGNPVLFSKSMKHKIMKIKGDFGAKKIFEENKNQIMNIDTKDLSVTQNFNTIKDFNF